MNTKKAIEFIEGHKVDYNDEIGYQGKIKYCKDNNITKMYNEVIFLLKRNEAYRQMWKELEFECREIHASPRAFQMIKHWMKNIEQEYLPS